MNELTTKDMTEYLKNAIELESSIYKQEKAIESAKESIRDKKRRNSSDMYDRKKNIEKLMPKKKELAKPEDSRSSRKFSPVTLAKESVRADIVYTVISIIIIILGFVFKVQLMKVIGLIAIICFLGRLFINRKKVADCVLKEQQLDIEYEQKIAEYKKQLDINEQEYKKALEVYEQAEKQAKAEYEEAQEALTRASEVIEEKLSEPLAQTRQVLEKLYASDVIFPKYRNMIAICTIYEYFATGRCTTLVGADGAYNLYESELRQNLIIGKLDTIISQLEEIKQNQYTLYTELQKTNSIMKGIYKNVTNILNSVEQIEDATKNIAYSSYITSYCAQVTAQNTEALKYIALINS